MFPARAFPSRVLEVSDAAAGVKTLRLEAPADFTFVPGMWLMLRLAGHPHGARAYSIASSPLQKGSVEVSLAPVGGLSERLCALRPGAALSARGPFGKWVYQDSIRHAALISAGTGLTPFRCICRYVLDKKLPNRLTLLYSARSPAEILYREELEGWRAAGIRVFVKISRPENAAGWDGPTGKLSIEDVRREVPDLAEPVFFLCGPNTLVERIGSGLRAAGVAPERLRLEKWGDYSF